MAGLVVHAVVVGLHEVHALVQRIGHDDLRLLVEVVDVRDRVDDLVADLLRAGGIQVRRLLLRLLRIIGLDGDVDHVGLGFCVVVDLHARRVLHGRHGLAFVQVARGLEHLDRQRHFAAGEGLNLAEVPGHGMVLRVVHAAVAGREELHALVQLIGDLHRHCHVLVVIVTNLIRDLLADLHGVLRRIDAYRFLGRRLGLVGLHRDRDLVGVVADFRLVGRDDHGGRVADLRLVLGLLGLAVDLNGQRHAAAFEGVDFLQQPGDRAAFLIISTAIVRRDEGQALLQHVGDGHISLDVAGVVVVDGVGEDVTLTHRVLAFRQIGFLGRPALLGIVADARVDHGRGAVVLTLDGLRIGHLVGDRAILAVHLVGDIDAAVGLVDLLDGVLDQVAVLVKDGQIFERSRPVVGLAELHLAQRLGLAGLAELHRQLHVLNQLLRECVAVAVNPLLRHGDGLLLARVGDGDRLAAVLLIRLGNADDIAVGLVVHNVQIANLRLDGGVLALVAILVVGGQVLEQLFLPVVSLGQRLRAVVADVLLQIVGAPSAFALRANHQLHADLARTHVFVGADPLLQNGQALPLVGGEGSRGRFVDGIAGIQRILCRRCDVVPQGLAAQIIAEHGVLGRDDNLVARLAARVQRIDLDRAVCFDRVAVAGQDARLARSIVHHVRQHDVLELHVAGVGHGDGELHLLAQQEVIPVVMPVRHALGDRVVRVVHRHVLGLGGLRGVVADIHSGSVGDLRIGDRLRVVGQRDPHLQLHAAAGAGLNVRNLPRYGTAVRIVARHVGVIRGIKRDVRIQRVCDHDGRRIAEIVEVGDGVGQQRAVLDHLAGGVVRDLHRLEVRLHGLLRQLLVAPGLLVDQRDAVRIVALLILHKRQIGRHLLKAIRNHLFAHGIGVLVAVRAVRRNSEAARPIVVRVQLRARVDRPRATIGSTQQLNRHRRRQRTRIGRIVAVHPFLVHRQHDALGNVSEGGGGIGGHRFLSGIAGDIDGFRRGVVQGIAVQIVGRQVLKDMRDAALFRVRLAGFDILALQLDAAGAGAVAERDGHVREVFVLIIPLPLLDHGELTVFVKQLAGVGEGDRRSGRHRRRRIARLRSVRHRRSRLRIRLVVFYAD